MTPIRFAAQAVLLLFIAGCLASTPRQHKKSEDQLLFTEAQQALDARDFKEAIQLFQAYIDNFPDTKAYSWAYQRLGQAFEGLLDVEYRRRLEAGEPKNVVTKEFLSQFGHFDCWEEGPDGLAYNLKHYRLVIEKFPQSPIADEAAYKLVPWQKDYNGKPRGPLTELEHLESVLEHYPTTSLRYEILYKMAHRCHIAYEMYAFSTDATVRDAQKASLYRKKAIYLYRMALKSPRASYFTQKAWEGLEKMETGGRIYVFQ